MILVQELNTGNFILINDIDFDANLHANYDQLYYYDRYHNNLGKDYKFIREQIKKIANNQGFNNLRQEEKEIAARWFVVGKTDRDTIYTIEEQALYGRIWHHSAVQARQTRMIAATSEIYNRLSYTDAILLFSESEILIKNYINGGIEGTLEGNPEGLFDYLEARTGTSYETTGLASKSFSVYGMADCIELSVKIMDILKNGNY